LKFGFGWNPDTGELRTLLLAPNEREIAQQTVIEKLAPKAEALDRIGASPSGRVRH
jgi:hypothetical protein